MVAAVQLKVSVSTSPLKVIQKADPKSYGFGKAGSCFKQD